MNQDNINLELISLNNFFAKSRGLMFMKNPKAIYFETRLGIHTFFMYFPIDVIILDKNNQVVKFEKDLKPNNLFFWNPKYKKVIELPKGKINELNIKLGSIIKISYL